MPKMTPYEKGYERERKAREILESWFGCVTIRSGKSGTPVDIIAGNGIEVFAVQVKPEEDRSKIDMNELRKWAEMYQAIPTEMLYCKGGRWKIYFDGEQYTPNYDYGTT